MKYIMETIYGPGYFENIVGVKKDIRAIKFVLFKVFDEDFQTMFEKYYHVFGNPIIPFTIIILRFLIYLTNSPYANTRK